MAGIFISYRREDSAPYAGRLCDRLAARFGAEQVFMDVDDIPPGADFSAHIGATVGSCDALIAVIGKNWLNARNDAGQLRLSDPNDYVSLEIALALQRGILVIPVLVGGAAMPKPEELRGDLKPLSTRNALTLNDAEFQRDTEILVQALDKLPGLPKRTTADNPKTALRKRLLRRLIWKVPLILALVSFAVWWQSKANQEQSGAAARGSTEKTAAAITGSWAADVKYDWGDKYTEAFWFQPEGGKLFGTASFLGTKRGIEEGKIEGEAISFFVRYQEISGTETREHKNYYWGKLAGSETAMRMQDDRGSPPVDLVLRKISVQNDF